MDSRQFYIAVLIILFSCQDKNDEKGQQSKGNITKKIESNNGVAHGLYEEYYKTGELKAKSKYTNGRLNDTIFYFYKNGKIKKKGLLKDGLRTGWWIFYDSLGNIKNKIQYKTIKGKLYKDKIIHYDKKGNIDYDLSSFYKIELPDTLNIGPTIGKIKYYSNSKADDVLLTVIVKNRYSPNKIKADTFSDGTLNPRFGVYAYKEGKQKIDITLIETTISETPINKDSVGLTIEKHEKIIEKIVYVKDTAE